MVCCLSCIVCACWLYVFVRFVCDRLGDVEQFVVEWLIVFVCFKKTTCLCVLVWELVYAVVWFGVCSCCLEGSMCLCVLVVSYCVLLYDVIW